MRMETDFLDVFYGSGNYTNFGAALFQLIKKADPENLEKLSRGFPLEVELYRWWLSQADEPTEDQVVKKVREIESRRP